MVVQMTDMEVELVAMVLMDMEVDMEDQVVMEEAVVAMGVTIQLCIKFKS